MTANLSTRAATGADAARMVDIYNHYVLTTAISFEELPISATEMEARMDSVARACLPWLLAERDGQLLGYAYASRWRERQAYRFSVETTVYLAPDAHGQGVGSALYTQLFDLLRGAGYHTAMAVIALPNAPSIALHEKFGMRKVAHFSEVGHKFGRWHDVGNWQVVW